MKIIITGGAGFLGQKLAHRLVKSNLPFRELLLVDRVMPDTPNDDERISCQATDLSSSNAVQSLITKECALIFHLAAVVSSQAESDFDLGWKINVDITRQLLEACRHTKQDIRFVFASSVAVFGGELPPLVRDDTALMPRSSYGTQKAIGELLVNDYSRKGFVDGISLRVPTVCIRPGRPNQAASSFVSAIIREPLQGEKAVCPVSPDLPLWLTSPDTVITNFIHAAVMDASLLNSWRTINLPGITITVQAMLDSLRRATDEATLSRIVFEKNESFSRIVSSWPGALDNTTALGLGFTVDKDFDDFIKQFRKTS